MVAIIIVLVVICVIIIIAACLSGPLKRKYRLYKEKNKRKAVANDLTVEEFASYAGEFKAIFSPGMAAPRHILA